MIRFKCGNCGRKLQAEDRKAGTDARCPACQFMTSVPFADPDAPTVEFAAAAAPKAANIWVPAEPPERTLLRKWTRPVRRHKRLALAIVSIIAILGWFVLWPSKGRPVSASAANNGDPQKMPALDQLKRDGILFAKERVLAHLKAPKTAEFTQEPEIVVHADRADFFQMAVDSSVDAKNVLGVPLRDRWFAQVHFEPQAGWAMDLLTVGDTAYEMSDKIRALNEGVKKATDDPYVVTKRRRGFGNEGFSYEIKKAPWKLTLSCDSGAAKINVGLNHRSVAMLEQRDAETPIAHTFSHSGAGGFYVLSPHASWELTISEARNGEASPPPEEAKPQPTREEVAKPPTVRLAKVDDPKDVEASPESARMRREDRRRSFFDARRKLEPIETWSGKGDREVKFEVSETPWELDLRSFAQRVAIHFEVLDDNGIKLWQSDLQPPSRNRNHPASSIKRFTDGPGKFRLRIKARGGEWKAELSGAK